MYLHIKKYVHYFLSTVICLNLLVLPIEQAKACSLNSSDKAERKNECTERGVGFEWIDKDCACVSSQEAEDLKAEYEKCQEEESVEKQRECAENLAVNEASLTQPWGAREDDFSGWKGAMEQIGRTVNTMNLVTTIIAFAGSKGGKGGTTSTCVSRILFGIASLVHFGGEVYSYFFVEKKLRELRNQYACWAQRNSDGGYQPELDDEGEVESEISDCQLEETESEDVAMDTSSSSTYDMQMKAFDFLYDEQEIVEKIAKTKMIVYSVSAGLYAAAVLVGALECSGVISGQACDVAGINDEEKYRGYVYNHKSFSEYLELKNYLPSGQKYLSLISKTDPPLFLDKNNTEQLFQYYLNQPPIKENFIKQTLSAEKISSAILDIIFARSFAQSTFQGESKNAWEAGWSGNDNRSETNAMFTTLIIGGGISLLNISDSIRGFMQSACGIAIFSAIPAFTNTWLAVYAGYEMTNAQENMEKAEEIKELFLSATQYSCPEGRDDRSNPPCYCMTDENERDYSKRNAETCLNYWAQLDLKLKMEGENKEATKDGEIIGCLTKNRTFDPDCKCKKFVNSQGQNACMTTPIIDTNINGLGAGIGLGESLEQFEAFSNGDLMSKNLSLDDLLKKAKRNGEVGRQLLEKTNKKLVASGKKPLDLSPKNLAGALKSVISPTMLKSALDKGTSARKLIAENKPKSKALDKAIKEVKKLKYEKGGKNPFAKKKEKKKSGMDFNFGGDSAKKKKKEMDFMGKNYKYKGTDIVKDDGVSIWRVISNRYNQALERLVE